MTKPTGGAPMSTEPDPEPQGPVPLTAAEEREWRTGTVSESWLRVWATIDRDRAALATPSSVTPDLRAALTAAIETFELIADMPEFGGDVATEATIGANNLRAALASVTPSEPTPLTAANATERERLAYGRGLNQKAIDGSHVPGSEAER